LFRVDYAKERAALADERQPQELTSGESYLVSEHTCVGQSAHTLAQQLHVSVKQIRRGDKLVAVQPDTVLQLGDLVTVVPNQASRQNVRKTLGDSLKELSEIDLPTTALGIGIGLLIGLIPIPLPGGIRFHLGFAGGPLLVALVLGYLGRSGPLHWQMPPGLNQTLRHLGISLFLAGIGTRAGYAFVSTLQELGPKVVLIGAVVTFTYSALTMVLGYKLLKMPMSVLSGLLAGMHTQPAALVFAEENAHSDAPYIGYATAYPVGMVVKIILAQVLLNLLM
jgi:putative transport protein